RLLQFGVAGGIAEQIVNLLIESFDCLSGRTALRAHADIDQTFVVVARTNTAAHGIRKGLCSAQVLEETRRKPATEDFIHHPYREIVRIVAADSQADKGDITLIHIILLGEVDTGLWSRNGNLGRIIRSAFRQ